MSPDTLEEAAFFQTIAAHCAAYARKTDGIERVLYQKESLVMYAMARLLLGIE